MSEIIPLTRGFNALVDEKDFVWISKYSWCVAEGSGGLWYAKRKSGEKTIYMHRFILNAPHGVDVDHINGNTLDNRRKNLQIVTHSENLRKAVRKIIPRSGYFGVSKSGEKWRVRLRSLDGKIISFGTFKNAIEAAKAADTAAIERDGKFARLNFPDDF